MWLTTAVVFLGAGLGLRLVRERVGWSRLQRAALALMPTLVTVAGTAGLITAPSGLQMSERAATAPFGESAHVVRTTETVGFIEGLGGRGVALLGIPLLVAALPLAFGLRPWPRRAFSVSATVLTLVSLLSGFSIGLQLFPGAMAAWVPVLGGPRT